MEKFSFYELLSFIVPGFTVIVLVNSYSYLVFGNSIIDFSETNLIEVLLFFSIALFFGLILQIFTFWILDDQRKFKIFVKYRGIVFKTPVSICSSVKHLSNVMPHIEKWYKAVNKHHQYKSYKGVSANDVFHLAYYYLEINDKIGPTKNFQSLYFWLRNTMTLCLVCFPVLLILSIYLLILNNPDYSAVNSVYFTLFVFILFFFLMHPTQWLREKMVIKLFWSYYTELIHKENNK